MTAVDPAALRELAQGLPSTPTLADAAHWVGAVAEDREGYLYLSAAGPLWQSVGGMDWDTTDLAKRDSLVKRLPVSVDQLTAVRAALEGAAAELERLAALSKQQAEAGVSLAMSLKEATGQRDRARDTAVALEAECAELRTALERIRACKVPTLEEADEAARAFVTPDAFAQFAVIDARIIAAAVLARTDPLRAGAEGGEDRG